MLQALPKGEKIVVIGSENVGQLLKNVEKTYPGTTKGVNSVGIIGRGTYGLESQDPHAINLFKGDQVMFS
jgi:hypothetical protein